MSHVIQNRLHTSIYAEHFEEAAIMAQHRDRWLEDPELTLHDLVELERRQAAHLDALVIGYPHTWPHCEQALREGSPAQLHVATRIACRCRQTSLLDELAARLDALDDDERPAHELAASAALGLELPNDWALMIEHALSHPRLGPVVAEAIGQRSQHGQRSVAVQDALRRCVVQRGRDVDVRLIRALAELRDSSAHAHIRRLLSQVDDRKLWSELALACLKLGDSEISRMLASNPEYSDWAPVAQVHAFDIPCAWLHASFERAPTHELLLAIALRGDPASLTPLTRLLPDAELGTTAASALITITGSELSHDDDHADWTAWLDAHARAWNWGARYRGGRPWSPVAAREGLVDFRLPLVSRAAIRDELTIRHGQPSYMPTAPALAQLTWLNQQGQAVCEAMS